MRKHATKDGNQQKLRIKLGEITSGSRYKRKPKLSVQYLIAIYHRRASLKCPLPMLYDVARMRGAAICG